MPIPSSKTSADEALSAKKGLSLHERYDFFVEFYKKLRRA